MPEAAVDEHGDFSASEDNVWSYSHSSEVDPKVAAVSESRSVKQ